MEFALLFLGLLPLLFLGDLFGGPDDDESEGAPAGESAQAQTSVGTTEATAALTDAEAHGSDPAQSILKPITEDPTPFEGEDIDPDTVLKPITTDPDPTGPQPVDPDTVLKPIDDPLDDRSTEGQSTLQRLVHTQSALNAGVERLGTLVSDVEEHVLGDDADMFTLAGDGAGAGQLDDVDGTPVLFGADGVGLVDGGEGDDRIEGGSGPLYAFGGDGNDRLTAGDGSAALFGGNGADDLAGGAGEDFADGGLGNDRITGGHGDDHLFGGGHAAADAAAQDDDRIDGGAGNDTIAGGFGADVLRGQDGDDVIDHHGRLENEVGWERDDFEWHIDGSRDDLSGGAGDDLLILDRGDHAEGGTGDDTFWIYAETGSTHGAAEIADFEAGRDFLRITLDPSAAGDVPSVKVSSSADGRDGLVIVNDEVIAVLRGGSDATDTDILVDVFERIYA